MSRRSAACRVGDGNIEEPERDEDRTPAEVAKISEVVVKRTIEKVNEKMSNPKPAKMAEVQRRRNG
jgi:hypothetical protein